MLEWLKRHAWKACNRQKRFGSSNLPHSANFLREGMPIIDIPFILLVTALTMCSKEDCISKIREQLPYICSEYGVTGLCIFGSVARGDNRPDSDVDLLVDMPPKLSLISALKDYLEGLLHTSVDLIRRHSHLSQRFLNTISKDAISIL